MDDTRGAFGDFAEPPPGQALADADAGEAQGTGGLAHGAGQPAAGVFAYRMGQTQWRHTPAEEVGATDILEVSETRQVPQLHGCP
ncbi:MAG TPA: hypothetical protein VK966_03115, partial [Longimicrobiales bacterium]|nr:hypothetical protein [Longimicrobiales bacterium]